MELFEEFELQISEDDWNYYLSYPPKEYVNAVSTGLKERNRFIVDKRFTRLLYIYAFHENSRYQAQRIIYADKRIQRPVPLFRALHVL